MLEYDQTDRSVNRLVRLGFVAILLLAAAFVLASCSNGASLPKSASGQSENVAPTIDLSQLPEGLGRGYPVVSLENLGNSVRGVQSGSPAPNFHMVLGDGNRLSLADLQGSPVLINFWATWCGPCRLEMPDIVDRYATSDDLVVLAINVQEELAAIEPFAADFQMMMPIVRDESGELRRLYDVRGMPTSIFIDRDGRISTVWAGLLTPAQLDKLLDEIL